MSPGAGAPGPAGSARRASRALSSSCAEAVPGAAVPMPAPSRSASSPVSRSGNYLTGRESRTQPDEERAGPALVRPSQITSRRLVRATPPATRATVYPIKRTPPTHAGGAYGNADRDLIMTSEATAGAMTGAPSIQPWWKRL